MEIGKVLCLKTTGELVIVIPEDEFKGQGKIMVRRPVMGKDGIAHETNAFYPFELETIQEHLQTELSEVIYKARLQKEAFAAEQEAQLAERKTDVSVN